MASKNDEVTSFSVDVPVKKESLQLEKSKQITFCWDNLTVTAKGTDARKGLCGTKIGRRDFVPDKNILQNGKSTIFFKPEPWVLYNYHYQRVHTCYFDLLSFDKFFGFLRY
jgi:hypothetical protein